MSRVLAAIDDSTAAGPVLEFAKMFANVLGARPEAVYVGTSAGTAGVMANRSGVPMRVPHGVPERVIVREAAADDVVLTVMGARRVTGRQPLGHVTLHVMQESATPMVIVPPECASPRIDRVLIPLDGDPETGRADAEFAGSLARAGAELVVIHTFTADTTPTMLNHGSALEIWGDEFLIRACPELAGARLELRTGVPAARVVEAAREECADLIVLAWKRVLADGHGQVVLDTVTRATVPTLLLSVDTAPRRDNARAHESSAANSDCSNQAPPSWGALDACPGCNARSLLAVFDGERTNFLCRSCNGCWHIELGWVTRVVPMTCPGCLHLPECSAAYEHDHPTSDGGTPTSDHQPTPYANAT